MIRIFKYIDLEVEYEIIYKNNKNSYLRIVDNKLVITTSKRVSEKEIIEILKSKYEYLKKHLNNKTIIKNVDDKYLFIFGKKYDIEVNDQFLSYYVDNNKFVVYINSKYSTGKQFEIVKNKIYTDALKKEILKQYKIIIKKIPNYKYNVNFKLVNCKTYFGQCNVRTKEIKINIFLGMPNAKYLYMILCHEIAHLYYLNHQKEFHDLVEKLCKNHRKLEKELKKIYNGR